MSSRTTTEVLGFSDDVIGFMKQNQAALLAKGVDVTAWITGLQTERDNAATQNVRQESLKATLKTQTTITENALNTAWNSSSTKLDACVGALGKTTDLGQAGAKLRSKIRRNTTGGAATPTPTSP